MLRHTVLLGVTSGLALIALPAHAQLDVTGGGATLENVNIFVPETGDITPVGGGATSGNDPRTVIYDSTLQDGSLRIQTTQGSVPTTAIFRATTLPTITSIAPTAGPVAVGAVNGATGSMLGTLSFRGASESGGPLFFNIPTTLNFTIGNTQGFAAAGGTVTEFRAEGFILQETGFGATRSSVGVVQRNTPVTLVQYGTTAQNQTVFGTNVPAARYDLQRLGDGYTATSLDLTFNSGTIFSPPGIGLTATSGSQSGENNQDNTSNAFAYLMEDGSSVIWAASYSPVNGGPDDYDDGSDDSDDDDDEQANGGQNGDDDNSDDNEDDDQGNQGRHLGRGRSQRFAVLPRRIIVIGVFVFNNVRSGYWFDPPTADGFQYSMVPRDVPVGLSSRVFPGLTGVSQSDDSVFTAITGFPTGIDADERFTVSVGNVVLGEFSPGDEVRFSDYAEVLGEALINGEGVADFVVSGINPAVDTTDPEAFPLKIDFSTPTASFEMRALDAVAEDDTATQTAGLPADATVNVSARAPY